MTKILLVEDDKSLREIYGVRLLAEGYDIVSAGDGEEALAMAIKERPALIVSDVMMPKISGFDMLDILRSTTETRDVKVIMMTALSSEDQRARGEALGADRYLVKSQVGIEDVVRTVHEVMGDAPGSTPQPSQSFAPSRPPEQQNQQGPSQQQQATPRPAPPMNSGMPQRPPAAPVFGQPQQSAQPAPQQYSPSPQQQPEPTQQPTQSNQPQARPEQSSNLPQPTAPFSTNRPSNLGDRIIHPLENSDDQKPDLANLMAQELQNAQNNTQPASSSSNQAPAQSAQPWNQPQPQSSSAEPQPYSQPPQQPSGIDFEETPRAINSTTQYNQSTQPPQTQ